MLDFFLNTFAEYVLASTALNKLFQLVSLGCFSSQLPLAVPRGLGSTKIVLQHSKFNGFFDL